jgi:hypothetical protein
MMLKPLKGDIKSLVQAHHVVGVSFDAASRWRSCMEHSRVLGILENEHLTPFCPWMGFCKQSSL